MISVPPMLERLVCGKRFNWSKSNYIVLIARKFFLLVLQEFVIIFGKRFFPMNWQGYSMKWFECLLDFKKCSTKSWNWMFEYFYHIIFYLPYLHCSLQVGSGIKYFQIVFPLLPALREGVISKSTNIVAVLNIHIYT